mmetsp:Transcript_150993/g.485237  ORF Transcript_150993/g.485237 Transcript_150993/m.485237 type:complete len:494 (+) Transcript_150993:185-1666(+)
MSLASESVPRLDTKHVRRVCELSPCIKVVSEAGSEYSAFLAGRKANFIDACSSTDPYPELLWTEITAFFGSGGAGESIVLPGGRYTAARALVAANLPFLAGRTLGEVCHIVQLAVSERQILGYFDGQVVAHDRSEAVVKMRCAALQQRPGLSSGARCRSQTLPRSELAYGPSWPMLPNRPGCLCRTLSDSRFQLELSDTAFGHCRVSGLLQDERLQDICALQADSSGYVVVPTSRIVVEEASDRLLEPLGQPPLVSVMHTFIHLASTPSPTKPKARSSSMPRNLTIPALPRDVELLEEEDADAIVPERVRFCLDQPLCLDDESTSNLEALFGFPLATPSPQYEMPFVTAPVAMPEGFSCTWVTPSPWLQAPTRAPIILSTMPAPVPPLVPSHVAEEKLLQETESVISLFKGLGFEERVSIDAITEAADSSDAESEEIARTPLCAEPLSFGEDEGSENEDMSCSLLGRLPFGDTVPAVSEHGPFPVLGCRCHAN